MGVDCEEVELARDQVTVRTIDTTQRIQWRSKSTLRSNACGPAESGQALYEAIAWLTRYNHRRLRSLSGCVGTCSSGTAGMRHSSIALRNKVAENYGHRGEVMKRRAGGALEAMASAPWVSVDEAMPEHPGAVWRRRTFPKTAPVHQANSMLTAVQLIKEGLCVGVVARMHAAHHRKLLQLPPPRSTTARLRPGC